MMSNSAWVASYAAWQMTDYLIEFEWLSAHPFDLFPWLYTVSPFEQIDLCVVDGDRQFTVRISFWLWLTTLATWVDLYKLTCGLDGYTKRSDKPHPRSHRVRRAPEVRRQTESLASSPRPSPAGDQHGIVSGKVQADSVGRQSCKREKPELLIEHKTRIATRRVFSLDTLSPSDEKEAELILAHLVALAFLADQKR
jgi:hypothetical protein